MSEPTIVMTVDTVNQIMNVLGQQPYTQVAGLMIEIQKDIARHNESAVFNSDQEGSSDGE